MADDCYIDNFPKNQPPLFFARYLQKCVTQIYRALYEDAMFVPFGGAQTFLKITFATFDKDALFNWKGS